MKIVNNEEEMRHLQDGHGEWVDNMIEVRVEMMYNVII